MTKMRFATVTASLLVLLPANYAFAQAADTPYQVGVVTNDLTRSDASVTMSNTGASATTTTNGALCMNVYAMSAANSASPSAVAACCTCHIQPNGYVTASVNNDILFGVSPRPKNVVIKLMASTGTAGACNGSTVGTGANVLATGMVAWMGSPQSAQLGAPATPNASFTASTLSAAELTRLNSQCGGFAVRACNAACQ
jgi:cytochrome c553